MYYSITYKDNQICRIGQYYILGNSGGNIVTNAGYIASGITGAFKNVEVISWSTEAFTHRHLKTAIWSGQFPMHLISEEVVSSRQTRLKLSKWWSCSF